MKKKPKIPYRKKTRIREEAKEHLLQCQECGHEDFGPRGMECPECQEVIMEVIDE